MFKDEYLHFITHTEQWTVISIVIFTVRKVSGSDHFCLVFFVVVVIWFGFLVSRNVRTDWCGCKNVYVFMCLVVCCVCAKKKYVYMLVWYDQVAMEHVISIIHVICIRVYCSHVNWFNVFFVWVFCGWFDKQIIWKILCFFFEKKQNK